MDTAEQTIRSRLAQRQYESVLKYFDDRPESIKVLTKAVSEYASRVKGALQENMGLDSEDVEDLTMEVSNGLLDDLRERLSPAGLAENSRDYWLKDAYTAEKEWKAGIEEELSKDGEIKGLLGDSLLELAKYPGLDLIKKRDQIARNLAETAKERGIDETVKDSAINEAIKKVFPTEMDYRKYVMQGRKASRISLQNSAKALRVLDLVQHGLGKTMESMMAETSVIYSAANRAFRIYNQRELIKIYGKRKKKIRQPPFTF